MLFYTWNYIQERNVKSNIQHEGDAYHQPVGLTFEEGTSSVAFYGAETLTLWNVDEK
jgi:hypothetical protein